MQSLRAGSLLASFPSVEQSNGGVEARVLWQTTGVRIDKRTAHYSVLFSETDPTNHASRQGRVRRSGRPLRRMTGCRQVASPQAALSTEESMVAEEESVVPPPAMAPPSITHHVSVLKRAAHTRKVPPKEVFQALHALEKTKVEDASHFLPTLGGGDSPGRTWMLIFTAGSKELRAANKGGEGGGSYFPITAVQRFDATAMEIENGVFLGPVGHLTFRGPMGWSGRRLSFLFDTLSLKLGSLGPFKFNIGKKEDEGRTPGVGKPGSKDPFFTWFYADEEIVAARGRGGGSALWVRCERVEPKPSS